MDIIYGHDNTLLGGLMMRLVAVGGVGLLLSLLLLNVNG